MVELINKRDNIRNNGLIQEVEGMSAHYDAIERVLFNTSYLANLNEDTIFETYKEVIQADHNR